MTSSDRRTRTSSTPSVFPLRRFAALFVLAASLVLLGVSGSCHGKPPPPPMPEATIYNQDVPAFTLSAEESALKDMVGRWAGHAHRAAPQLDPALTVVSRRVAAKLKEGKGETFAAFTNAKVQVEMTRAGVSDAAIRTQMASTPDLAQLDEMLQDPISRELGEGRYTHFGIGVARQSFPPGYYVMLLFSRRPIELDSFPKRAGVGDRIELSGKLTQGLKNPRAYVAKPSGVVRDVLLDVAGDGSFRTHIFFDEGPGEYRVEVSGESSLGPEIVALMPVQVGEFEPVERIEHAIESNTEHEAMLVVFEMINQARGDAGLARLTRDVGLEKIALGHAREMSTLRYAAHRSPTTGMISDRANQARLKWRRVGENVALNQTAFSAHQSLMDSPAHRANVLDAGFTHVGVGVVFADDGHGHRLVYLVENFMEPAK
jgi:uncharacterized protein YkwD